MIRILAIVLLAAPASADVEVALDMHVLPGFARLATAASSLAKTPCAADALCPAFSETALAWAAVSHLMISPAKKNGRARVILFWPDGRDAARAAIAGTAATGGMEP